MRTLVTAWAFVLWTAGCGEGNSGRSPAAMNGGWELSLDPPTGLEAAQPVVALVLTSAGASEGPSDPILVEGEPSKVSIGKYLSGETTESLAERIVPTRFENRPDKCVLRPYHGLALGQRYFVLAREGVLGSILVDPSLELTYLFRVWPPRDSTEAAVQTIYCGAIAPTESTTVELFPGGQFARLEPGLDESMRAVGSCVRIIPDSTGLQEILPPAAFGDVAFEPSPWSSGANLPEVVPLTCPTGESSIGPGCLLLEQGRAIVRAPASSTFWVLSSSLGWHLQTVEGGGRFSVPMIDQMGDGRLDGLVFDLAGRSFAAAVRITAPPPTARVVINEVMANPLGPEPAEEWIEVTNDGAVAAEMVGWKLRDQGGETDIPPLLLEPLAIALLVRDDFVGGQAGDVAPAVGTTLVRMPALGKNGLTNSGEALALVDSGGNVVSAFPARASEREGVSLARRSALSIDDVPLDFYPHASPGASPGASNVVE